MNIIKFLPFMIFAIPIIINLVNMKYLYDVKQTADCEEINSPYIELFFNFYLVELCLSLLLLMLISFVIHYMGLQLDLKSGKRILNIKNIKNTKQIIKILDKNNFKLLGKFVYKNQKIFKLFSLLISGITIKLLHDIGNEKECKDVDKYTRISLYVLQICGFIIVSYDIMFK